MRWLTGLVAFQLVQFNQHGHLGILGLIAVRLAQKEKIWEHDKDVGHSHQEGGEHRYNLGESSMNLNTATKK